MKRLRNGTESRNLYAKGAAWATAARARRPAYPARRCTALAVMLCAMSAWAAAQKPAAKPDVKSAPKTEQKAASNPAEKAIRESAEAFAEAFNRGDAKAVAALWTPDGRFVLESGEVLKGRDDIEKAYAKFFEQRPGDQIRIEITSIEFPSDSVAIEDGRAKSIPKKGGPSSSSRYTVVHMRKDGKWLMADVHDMPDENAPEQSPLSDLQWMIGNWQAKAQNKVLHTRLHWVVDNKFIQRDYTVDQDGVTTASGFQIIGWDPQAGQIRSWSFDSTGGHGTGLWTPTPEGYTIDSGGTLADGTPISSTDFLVHVQGEDRVMGWRSINRMAGDMDLPDMPEVVLDRAQEKQ